MLNELEEPVRGRNSLGLWIVAALMSAATITFYFYDPTASDDQAPEEDRTELESTVSKAATYYEFGHYGRAAETYALAAERGMDGALEWYRYAHSLELSESFDLGTYVAAYQRLLEQAPTHEYTETTEAVLHEHATEFDYEQAVAGAYEEGMLTRLSGTVSRVTWGRVASQTNTLYVATRAHDWLGHMGDEVMVVAPRHRTYQSGHHLAIIGRYEGWITTENGSGPARRYPRVVAAGVRVIPAQ